MLYRLLSRNGDQHASLDLRGDEEGSIGIAMAEPLFVLLEITRAVLPIPPIRCPKKGARGRRYTNIDTQGKLAWDGVQ